MLSIDTTFVESGAELVVRSNSCHEASDALLTLYGPEGATVTYIRAHGRKQLQFSLESVPPGVYTAEVKLTCTGEATARFIMVAQKGTSKRLERLNSAVRLAASAGDWSIEKRAAIAKKVRSEFRRLGLDDLADEVAIELVRPPASDEREPPVNPVLG